MDIMDMHVVSMLARSYLLKLYAIHLSPRNQWPTKTYTVKRGRLVTCHFADDNDVVALTLFTVEHGHSR